MNKNKTNEFRKRFNAINGFNSDSEIIIYMLGLLYTKLEKKVNTYLSRFSITSAQFNILGILANTTVGHGINQLEISRRMLVSQANITRIIEKLAQDKLISRKENKADRRNNLISITKKGKMLLSELGGGYAELVKNTFKDFSREEKGELFAGLSNFLYIVEKSESK
ncbi:DNA-binding transcriptional regulator [Parelusimicrobium proximum]|uniref:MarR family winged helix-turn-helix transcriptional regulator n=1 Tax=Parelusimicrobium proximum TaxID=3228953 RepID=UPI003D162885